MTRCGDDFERACPLLTHTVQELFSHCGPNQDGGVSAGPIRISERANASNGRHSESFFVEVVPSSRILGHAQEELIIHEKEVLAVS